MVKAPAAIVAVAVNVVKDAKASVQAVYQAAVVAAGDVVKAVSTAVTAVSEFVQDNWKTIVTVAAGIAVAVGCTALTAGAGAAACLIAGAAVVGALSNSLNCPKGRSVAGCAARGAAAGAVGGAITVATGGVGGGAVVAALAAGGGAAAEDASLQLMNTGHVDAGEVVTTGLLGGAFGAGSKLKIGCGKCFAKGTAVLTTKGNKAIEKVRKGDVVWARDLVTGKNVKAKVIATMSRTATAMMAITVGGAALTVTTEHPFHTNDRGWVQSTTSSRPATSWTWPTAGPPGSRTSPAGTRRPRSTTSPSRASTTTSSVPTASSCTTARTSAASAGRFFRMQKAPPRGPSQTAWVVPRADRGPARPPYVDSCWRQPMARTSAGGVARQDQPRQTCTWGTGTYRRPGVAT